MAVFLAVSAAGAPAPPSATVVREVRFWTLGDITRVVIEASEEFSYKADRVPDPDRVFFDLPNTMVRLDNNRRHAAIPVNDPRLKQIRIAETVPGTSRVVFDLEPGVEYAASSLQNPPRLIVELRASSTAPRPSVTSSAPPTPPAVPPPTTAAEDTGIAAKQTQRAGTPSPPATRTKPVPSASASRTGKSDSPSETSSQTPSAEPDVFAATLPPATSKTRTPLPPPPKPATTDNSQSMTRVLGLKVGRIVLDPGHGGHDTGTIGPNGLYEKDLVLDVARRLGALIESKLGADVILTRQDDTFFPLEKRTEIANQEHADLFLSIHANSSPVAATSGVETYYLNFTDNKSALDIAARENAGSSKTVYDLKDLIQKIALHDKIEESRQFASRIQQSLHATSLKANARTKDRGIRKAPFVVLIGASMPSVLAEVGFVTNPKDEALFRKPEYRQKVAEGLFQGLSRYASTLSQFQVAGR